MAWTRAPLVLAALLATGVVAAPASARNFKDIPVDELKKHKESTHFQVHYTTKNGSKHKISSSQAQKILGHAEYGRDRNAELGFTQIKDDGDGRTDIYVFAFAGGKFEDKKGFTRADDPKGEKAHQSSAFIGVSKNVATSNTKSVKRALLAHELLHVQQRRLTTGKGNSRFLAEATASWAAARATNTLGGHKPVYVKASGVPLPCSKQTSDCGTKDYVYNQWPYFEFLAQRYGDNFVWGIYFLYAAYRIANKDKADVAALDDALRGKGSSLGRSVHEWAVANATGDYSFAPLHGKSAISSSPPLDLKAGKQLIQYFPLGVRVSLFRDFKGGCAGCYLHLRIVQPGVLIVPGGGESSARRRRALSASYSSSVATDFVRTAGLGAPKVGGVDPHDGGRTLTIPWGPGSAGRLVLTNPDLIAKTSANVYSSVQTQP